MQKRHWCFTINNPTHGDELELDEIESQCNYIVYQAEQGSNGTEHIQGYVQMKKSKRLTEMKRLLSRAHLEWARGSPQDNKTYCTKDDTRVEGTRPYEFGEMVHERQRSDLKLIGEALVGGQSVISLARDSPEHYMRYNRGMHALSMMFSPLRTEKTKTAVFYGMSGTGKSLASHRFSTPYMVYEYSKSVQFYDGYDPQEYKTVIYDEFYGDMPWRSLLQVCDWTPMRVHIKGGQVPYNPEWNVFTSNKHPSEWYPNMMAKDVNRVALRRRIDVLIEFIDMNTIRIHKGTLALLPEDVRVFLSHYHIFTFNDLLMSAPGRPESPTPPLVVDNPRPIDRDYMLFLESNGLPAPQ